MDQKRSNQINDNYKLVSDVMGSPVNHNYHTQTPFNFKKPKVMKFFRRTLDKKYAIEGKYLMKTHYGKSKICANFY